MTRISKLLTSLAAISLFVAPAAAGSLSISIKGVRSDQGKVYVGVHAANAAVSFPDSRGVITGAVLPAKPGTHSAQFDDLPSGQYAVTAYHDENGNGKMDMNTLGVPKEGFGFSNDPTSLLPNFEASAVAIKSDDTSVAILTITYP